MVAAVAARPQPSPQPKPQRAKQRAAVALRTWIVRPDSTARGWAVDLSETGCRVGGAGSRFGVGDPVLVKIVLDDDEPPLVARAHVARFHPAVSCPQVCVQFDEMHVDEWFRLARFLDRTRVR